MAMAINATHLTETSAFPSAKAAIICDVCRKHVDMLTQCCSSRAQSCDETHKSPHESTEKHTSTIQLVQKDAGHFNCNICLDGCHDPVVTLCGHLFCWPCLYYWLSLHSVSQECPTCKANVQDKIIPLYGSGKVEHSMNSAAMMFPDMHIPCRPMPSRTDMPVSTNTNAVTDHDGERNHDSEIYTISAMHMNAAPSSNVGVFASMLRCCMTALPSYSGGFFCAHNGAAPRQRFCNEKEFVLHWAFIFVASIAIICFTVC